MTTQDFSRGAAYVDGAFVPISDARISVLDWGLTRSDAVYDVVHVVDGAFFRLQAHLDRFRRSMAMRRMDVGMTNCEIRCNLHEVAALSGLRDAYVAMVALRGRPRIYGSRRPADCQNHLVTYAIPWVDVVPKEVQERGASLLIADVPRVPDASVDPTVKNYQWNDLTTGLFQAHDEGFDSVVLCDADGYVTEGAGFNIFSVWNGHVWTPDHGCLQGITRATVLELCTELGIPFTVGRLRRAELEGSDEAFITSSGGGVIRVRQINDKTLPQAEESPVFKRLRQAYWDAHRNPRFHEPVGYHAYA